MRSPHLTLTLSSILLLPLLATAIPQDPAPAPAPSSSEPTTTSTSTSTSTLTVTRTLIRGTNVVIATLPAITVDDDLTTDIAPDFAAPTNSLVATDIILAPPPAFNSSITLAPSATGTGAGKPLYSATITGPSPASYTGGAATTALMGGIGGGGGKVVAVMGLAMVLMSGALF